MRSPPPRETFSLVEDPSCPLVAAALHCGHELRPEVAEQIALDERQRLYEEDPFTDRIAECVGTRLVARRSRFEVDLNRPREQAVYRRPEDAWGLAVWKRPPPEELVRRSQAQYDAFYRAAEGLVRRVADRHGRFVVLDLHSYNHRRPGPDAPPGDLRDNPEVNLGTESIPPRWRQIVDGFTADLRRRTFQGRPLDVRENVRFGGGTFCRWINGRFAATGCAIAIELKKTFMDEWTGRVDADALSELREALAATLPGLRTALLASG